MLQYRVPDTFVLATGKTATVRDFIKLCCAALDIDITFEGRV